MKQLDVVIPYIKSDSDELRYCLRSLKNIDHNKVFICGDKPDFISDKVIHIPRKYNGKNRQHDCELNLRLALEDNRLSDNFIYMNDDFFIIKEMKHIPNYQNGTIKELIQSRQSMMFRRHNKSLQETANYLENFDNPLSFELHVPIVMSKLDRLEISNDIIQILPKRPLLPRSIYGNIFCDINKYRKDVKVYTITDQIASDDFVSTLEGSFSGKAGEQIKGMFKEKSIYEN